MQYPNPMLWLAWALFAAFLVLLLWRKYLPAVRQAPPLPKETRPAPLAWLFCEEGTALDQRVRWFPLKPGGKTVVGALPRAATADTAYVYLTADDVREDHVVISYETASGRYRVESCEAAQAQHNNEALAPGQPAELADGDTLDLGRISRFRFTLTGPESAG